MFFALHLMSFSEEISLYHSVGYKNHTVGYIFHSAEYKFHCVVPEKTHQNFFNRI